MTTRAAGTAADTATQSSAAPSAAAPTLPSTTKQLLLLQPLPPSQFTGSNAAVSSAPFSATAPPVSPAVHLLSGAIAGLSVDLVLFPLDTIKTRAQSRAGFLASGGFRNLFNGLASTAAGSAPTAALFFVTYEKGKEVMVKWHYQQQHPSFSSSTVASSSSSPTAQQPVNPLIHCFSASLAEVVACLVRVPTENVKQKVQAGLYPSSLHCFSALTTQPSMFYRGFVSTILREIPFAFIQFPLYEGMKWRMERWQQQHGHHSQPIDSITCAAIGSVSGGIAAALTTPLDVVKTRMMLHRSATTTASSSTLNIPATSAASSSPPGILSTFSSIYAENPRRFFSGLVPRVLWISVGGGVFFGAYEMSKKRLEEYWR